jgi:hypothetical protein
MREKFTIQFINDHLDSLSFSPNTYSRTKTMAFPYKHILVIGATSGIGKAMADHFIAQDIKVTAAAKNVSTPSSQPTVPRKLLAPSSTSPTCPRFPHSLKSKAPTTTSYQRS